MITFRLSSTAMGSSTCSLRLYRQVVEGVREKYSDASKVYGIAVHKYIDTMYKTGNSSLAMVAAKKAFSIPKLDNPKATHLSDFNHLLNTCMTVWVGFVLHDSTFEVMSVDGRPLTEQTFSIKFYEDEFITVFLEGTLDKIGKFKDGIYAIGDWKTTSTWGKVQYFTQYELSRQLRFYRLATILESRIAPDSPIGVIGRSQCGVFIDAIFLKPDRTATEVVRSDVFQLRASEMIEFELMLHRYCKELSARIQNESILNKEGTLNGSCENKWGKCPYWHLCSTPPDVSKMLQARDFEIVAWNPQDYNSLSYA